MDFSIIKQSAHHALLFPTAKRDSFIVDLRAHLAEQKIIHEVIEAKVLDIDTARSLKEWNNKSYGAPKVMVLSFHTITHPAQNALLKVLEEPNENSRFILVTSNVDTLLPTVRSRVLEQKVVENTHIAKDVAIFLKTKATERMKLSEIQELLLAEDEEERKDRERLQAFISSIVEVLIRERVDTKIQKEIADLAVYASDPSSSAKSLIEYIALRAPRIVC